jgi:hypothetical protein
MLRSAVAGPIGLGSIDAEEPDVAGAHNESVPAFARAIPEFRSQTQRTKGPLQKVRLLNNKFGMTALSTKEAL